MRGYTISKSLQESMDSAEIHALAKQGIVNLGWWTRDYDGTSEPIPGLQVYLLSQYADGYYQATKTLLDHFVERPGYSDSEALPILFLFCQFAELALKGAIQAAICILEADGKPVPEVRITHHNLSKLLDELNKLGLPARYALSEETQKFVSKIYELNEKSQAFRYPVDAKRSQVFLLDQLIVSMSLFQAEFNIHGCELNGLCGWLAESLRSPEREDDLYLDNLEDNLHTDRPEDEY